MPTKLEQDSSTTYPVTQLRGLSF